jgi:hypothetical protein
MGVKISRIICFFQPQQKKFGFFYIHIDRFEKEKNRFYMDFLSLLKKITKCATISLKNLIIYFGLQTSLLISLSKKA